MKYNIEWTEKSWNPVTGCKNTCYYCYARAIYKRYKWSFSPEFHPDRLNQPIKIKNPTMFFVCSVADLFGGWVPKEWIDSVFDVVKKCPNHIFQFLTKNPKRLIEFSPYPENAWIGCSSIDNKMANESIKYLGDIEAEIKFLSCEPLLDKIDVEFKNKVNWLIIGACTGKFKKQPEKEWVDLLLNNARKENIPVFIKPNLIWNNKIMDMPKMTKSYQESLFL